MRSHRTRNIISLLPPWTFTIIVLCGILWLTLGQPPKPPEDITMWEHTDKIVHAIMFGGLFFAAYVDWLRKHPDCKLRRGGWIMSALFAWSAFAGAFIELIQPLFGRTDDVWDLLADVAGIFIAWLFLPLLPFPVTNRANGYSGRR